MQLGEQKTFDDVTNTALSFVADDPKGPYIRYIGGVAGGLLWDHEIF